MTHDPSDATTPQTPDAASGSADPVAGPGREQPSAAPGDGSLVDEAMAAAEAAEAAATSDGVPDDDGGDGSGGSGQAPDQAADDELAVARMALDERTLDLQRLQAEFVNYKRRVERDRELIKENATFAALAPIVEVLDTIDRAREHGELEGGFKAISEQLERVVAARGLHKFGEVGEPFDPTLHEALSSMGPDPEGQAAVTTIKVVATSGSRIGDRVVRAAQVVTVEPVE